MKIAFIGAGSFIFARKLAADLCSFDDLPALDLALMDIDTGRLAVTEQVIGKLLAQTKRAVHVTATTNRLAALEGASFVVAMYDPNGLDARRREVMTCIAHGVPTAIGDTLGPAGVMKGVRTATLTLAIAKDMERVCPDALFMNYVNPMAMNCWIVNAGSRIRSVGMCHGLEHTRTLLAGFLGVPDHELDMDAAGINHMTWILGLRHRGADAYPELRKRLPQVRHIDPVRFAVMEATGYFVTESSFHTAEYLPYFRTHFKSLYVAGEHEPGYNTGMGYWGIECIHPTTPQGGTIEPSIPLGWDIHVYERIHSKTWETVKQQLLRDEAMTVKLSEEYGMRIIHSQITGTPRTLSLNVPNRGCIPNLPDGATVEVPVTVDRTGLHPLPQPPLPEPCASLCRRNIEVQSEVVNAVLHQDPRAVFNAMLLDPLAGAAIDLDQMRTLYNALLTTDAGILPDWLAHAKR
jgi:alpha-galactosidase